MKISEALQITKDFLFPEGAKSRLLTSGRYAEDAKGNSMSPNDPTATCFCTLGGLAKTLNMSAGFGEEQKLHRKFLRGAALKLQEAGRVSSRIWTGDPDMSPIPITILNDYQPELVPEMFAIAIADAQEAGQ